MSTEHARTFGDQNDHASDKHLSVQSPDVADVDIALYPSSLLANRHLRGRGNGSVRASTLQAMQRAHGNAYVQRAVAQERGVTGPEGGSLSDEVAHRIASSRGGGMPLDRGTRLEMEDAFSADLGDVRLHTGSDATDLSREIGANAFTIGSDIFFREGSGPSNRKLLAHEMTHILQQRGMKPDAYRVGPVGSSHEQEAEAVANKVVSGQSAEVKPSAGPAVARDWLDDMKKKVDKWTTFGDYKVTPAVPSETSDEYDHPENRRREEQKRADERGESPTPNKPWETPPLKPAPIPQGLDWDKKQKEKEQKRLQEERELEEWKKELQKPQEPERPNYRPVPDDEVLV